VPDRRRTMREPPSGTLDADPTAMLAPLATAADTIAGIVMRTGRTAPDVIT
jgi:phosphoglucomutase